VRAVRVAEDATTGHFGYETTGGLKLLHFSTSCPWYVLDLVPTVIDLKITQVVVEKSLLRRESHESDQNAVKNRGGQDFCNRQ
jgi:hypothetical protein